MKGLKKHNVGLLVFLMFLFSISMLWSMLQPFGAPPDEMERYKITEFIVNHGKLPHGGDPEIMLEGWGFSYGFQPILPYIFSAWAIRLIRLFTEHPYVIIITGRFVNVLIGLIMAIFMWKLSFKIWKEKSAAILFFCLVCLWPQVMFVHTYVNVDSMAMMSSVLLVYSWVLGLESDWDKKSCIMLGVGVGLCAMSYYDAYGFILCSIVIFIYSFLREKEKKKEMVTKGILSGAIASLIAGWWFIRSAILYDGDFLGLKTRDAYAEIYAADHLKPSIAPTWHNAGFSIIDMLKQTNYIQDISKSYIGMFEHMDQPILKWNYPLYFLIAFIGLAASILLLSKKTERNFSVAEEKSLVFHIILIMAAVIPNVLCLWASYDVDYQPQGRYILPMTVPLMYFVVLGWKKLVETLCRRNPKAVNYILGGISVLLVVLVLVWFKEIIFTKYYNNFIQMFKNEWRNFF